MVQVANCPGGETSRLQNVQGANWQGGQKSRYLRTHLVTRSESSYRYITARHSVGPGL